MKSENPLLNTRLKTTSEEHIVGSVKVVESIYYLGWSQIMCSGRFALSWTLHSQQTVNAETQDSITVSLTLRIWSHLDRFAFFVPWSGTDSQPQLPTQPWAWPRTVSYFHSKDKNWPWLQTTTFIPETSHRLPSNARQRMSLNPRQYWALILTTEWGHYYSTTTKVPTMCQSLCWARDIIINKISTQDRQKLN